MERWVAVGAMAVVLTALAGCAANRAEVVHAQAAAHVYHRPAPEIAAEVRALLADQGFVLTPSSDDVWVRTQWKWFLDDQDFATVRARYVIYVKRLTPHHCRVEAAKLTLTTIGMETYHPLALSKPDGQHTQATANYGKGLLPLAAGPRMFARDLDFEWALLRRVDPGEARRIEASVR